MREFSFVTNPRRASAAASSLPAWQASLSAERQNGAEAAIRAWPAYQETPLHRLPTLAEQLGIRALYYKDEGPRFGIGSFKGLGGGYAVFRVMQKARAADPALNPQTLTVCCATDGNHGRGVAWAAQQHGCQAVIFLSQNVSQRREAAIAAYGARIVRVPAGYDEAVRRAAATAEREGWIVVSDTAYDGYMDIPRDVMTGYTVMATEAIRALDRETVGETVSSPVSHIFLQTGVGGMAAAVTAATRRHWSRDTVRIILVDPIQADCWYQSIAAGKPTKVDIEEDSLMAGLSCGEVSLLAWPILSEEAHGVVALPDTAAAQCMLRLARSQGRDRPIVAGESAVAGLAGLMAACNDRECAEAFGLDAQSRVLVFGTEGATDPELYTEIVGERPESVAERGRTFINS